MPTDSTTYYVGDLHFDAPVDVPVPGPSGFAAYRVENPVGNVSMFLTYEYRWDASRYNPLQMVFLLDDGDAWMPRTLRAEHDPEEGAYVGANGAEHAAPGTPAAGTYPAHGLELHFTDARSGTLLLTWANLNDTPKVTLQWNLGTRMTKVAEGAEVVAARLAEFRGGARAATGSFVRASAGDAISFGENGTTTYLVLKVVQTVGGGEVTIHDTEGARAVDASTQGGMRYALTAAGRTTLTVDAAGVEGFNVFVVAATLPRGVLPERFWHEVWEYAGPSPPAAA